MRGISILYIMLFSFEYSFLLSVMFKMREAEKLHEVNSYRNQSCGLSQKEIIVVSDHSDTESDSKK